ncbi:helix-turn-helix transcriptional regulator [Streptomyces scopuliridis]|uniref:helix-turn-helix transcriptional regulator n=1 Tax=Streptomyces scopuliridis TaxID=452529 RepID=UPI00055F583C|nr:helix-turn-helix transcriptional regulator [Streptomyces scopuliridis]
MDNREEVKAFLNSRRARITPEDAGLTPHGRTRRVPGLRRSEVAELAGVSVEYYAKLERGDLSGVSESVLHALGRALRLDDAERSHLADLARAAGAPRRARRQPSAQKVRPGVARVLDGMGELPAFVHNGRLDVLAANPLTEALFAPVFAEPARPVNHARFNFLNPRARDFWVDWERAADNSVALLRTEAGRDPYNRALTDLVGELSTRSEAFRVRWASHDVHLHRTGLKHIHHPVVGVLHLSYEVFDLAADPGLALVVFSAEAGSPNDDALRLLAGWAATHDPADALARPDQA